jgi:hypothetical protein
MNNSICSVLQKGSEVKISAHASHKSPHLNGKIGKVIAMPVHPTTWFKIAFPDGEVATFRSSALIPLDANGKPLSGYSSQTHTTYQGKVRQAKNNTNYATGRDFVSEYNSVSQSTLTSSSGRKLREPRSRANSLDEGTVTSPIRRYRSNSHVGTSSVPSNHSNPMKRGRGRPPGNKASTGQYSNYQYNPYMDPYSRYGSYNTYGGDMGMNLQLGFSAYARSNNLNVPPRSLSLDEKSAMENAICVLLNLNESNGNSTNNRIGTTKATINTTAGMSIKLTDTTTNESMLYSFNGSPRGQVSPEHDSVVNNDDDTSVNQTPSDLFSNQNQNGNNTTTVHQMTTINPPPAVVDASGYEEDDEEDATGVVEEEEQDFFDDSSTSTTSRKRAFSTSSEATILPVTVVEEAAVPVPVQSSIVYGHGKGIAVEKDSSAHPHKKIRALSFGTDVEETDSETKTIVKRLSESALNIEGNTTININIYKC